LHGGASPASDAAPEDEPVEPTVEADPDEEPVDPTTTVEPDDEFVVPPADDDPPAPEVLPPGPLLDPLELLMMPVPVPTDPLELPAPPGKGCRFEFDEHAATPNALAAASMKILGTSVLRMQMLSGRVAFGLVSRWVRRAANAMAAPVSRAPR
jgi:hypothetical protein